MNFNDFNLIDLETGDVRPGLNLTVEDGVITDLTSGTVFGETESLGGGFLLPGLIDAHVHLVWEGQADPNRRTLLETVPATAYRAARSAWLNLAGGITTVRDLGGPHGVTVALAEAVADGRVAGSRVLAAGSPVAQTGGHVYTMAREADGPDEVRKAVREQIKAGADVIKLMCSGGAYTKGESIWATQMTVEEIRAAVDEAGIAERRVAAHALPPRAITNCLEAGVNTIEHAPFIEDEHIDLFKKNNSFMVPTLAPYYLMAARGPELGVPDYACQKSVAVMESYLPSIRKAASQGVNLAVGTDSGSPALLHPTIPWEAWLWNREVGLDALTVLRAMTLGGAEALGLEGRLGRIEPGYVADFVLYDENPLEDIRVLHTPGPCFKPACKRPGPKRCGP